MTADIALIERARAGDAGALDRLLGEVQGDLRRVARRSCAASDAEDAVQEALWQASRKIGTLRTVAAFAGWLARIVVRACRRLLLRQRDTVELTEALTPSADPVPIELRRDLVRTLESLPQIYREVLILRDVQELTAPETAQHLGLTTDAVKSRLHRARAMMRERLDAARYR